MTEIGVRFWPGASTGICREGLLLVAATPAGETTSLELLDVVTGGGGVEALLDVLFRDGFVAAPDFGILAATGGEWRVVVRGAARLTLAHGVVIEGGGIFRDQNVADAAGASLSFGPAPTGVTIPAGGGLVPAVGWVLDGAAGPRSVPAGSVEAADLPAAADAPPARVAPGDDAALGELDLTPYRDIFDPPAAAAEEAVHAEVAADRAHPVVSEQSEQPEQAAVEAEEPAAGATFVEHVPVVAASEVQSGPPTTPASQGFIDVVPFADDLPSAHPADLTGVPDAVQPAPVPVPPPSPPVTSPLASPAAPAAEAGRTVSRAEVRRQAAVAQQTVLAKRCAAGHLTQAHVPSCRVCGGVVPPQEVITTPRPVLGRLVLPTGQAYPLDRPVFLGREPRVPVGHAGETPHLVAIVDPRAEVSSQHAMVSLDYWSVEVTDLDSTNGTELVGADGRRRKLVPKTPVELEPGARLVLAEILEIRFEAVP